MATLFGRRGGEGRTCEKLSVVTTPLGCAKYWNILQCFLHLLLCSFLGSDDGFSESPEDFLTPLLENGLLTLRVTSHPLVTGAVMQGYCLCH